MRFSSWLSPSAGEPWPSFQLGILFTCLVRATQAVTFNPVPPPNLDLSQLGRVGLAGDFNGISLYEFEGQNEDGFSTNGSQSVLSRFPNGGFATLASADAGIHTMCSFVMDNGAMAGVIVGGNFTSLAGIESPGAALFNPNTSAITPLTGLSGVVSALLCDQATNTVYVGGSFKGANSTNAIAWVGTSGWTNLPFAGFNGPVTSISKASNGHIVFGGSFTGLGNGNSSGIGPIVPDDQPINIAGADISAASSSPTTGLSDPRNIVCKTNGADGPGNTWLVRDASAGLWKASFGFGFEPTKLRLYNTRLDGRGTKTWRFTAFPINGIMNFTYVDQSGNNASCTSECPLSNDPNVKFQDFTFVNAVGMNAFQIDISDWYGSGAGLDGIELFQNDIFSYAVNDFNGLSCAGASNVSSSTVTGPWRNTPSGQSVAQYLSATVSGSGKPSVTFSPKIKQSGNYSVNIYTPGCIQDGSCSTRGRVNVTGNMAPGSDAAQFQTDIFQTNNFDKYDQIYFGYIEAGSDSFRPSITLSPSSGQNVPNLSVVALRVGFTLISSPTSGLNSIFEFDPTQAIVDTTALANSTFNKAGMDLPTGASVNVLATSGETTFIGGNFSTDSHKNIFSIQGSQATSLSEGGLDGPVKSMFLNGSTLYVGGKFNKTTNGGTSDLNNIATYDTTGNSWGALGMGVNGPVKRIVPLLMNVTKDTPETVITLTGDFSQILAVGGNRSISVSGFAVWVPSQKNWLQNLSTATVSINGQLTAAVDVPGGQSLFAGSLSSSTLSANGVVSLTDGLSTFPINIQTTQPQSSSTLSKRAAPGQNLSGVITGLFYEPSGRQVTVLGGHFTATGSNGTDVNNLAFINGTNSDAVTGVGPSLSADSTILALAVESDTLYAGGAITGNVNGASVNGLIAYNLVTSTFAPQPPSPGGGDVHTITVQPDSKNIYIGGSFTTTGSLDCPAVCVFTNPAAQWDRPGTNLAGVANIMMWQSTNTLLVGGALVVDGKNVSLATYDVKSQNWTAAVGVEAIPGPVNALSAANSAGSELWVAGVATNGSSFLMKFDGTTWNSVGDTLGSGTNIRGLQVLSLSKSHDTSDLVESSKTLMITGSLNLPGFGNASAVLFNGTTFQPFALTSTSSNTGGSISQIFSQNQNFFSSPARRLAIGFVVLIALAIALSLIFLLVVAGVIAERIRRKREGYMPAPTSSFDRAQSRVPPDQLFSSIGQNRSGIEKQGTMI